MNIDLRNPVVRFLVGGADLTNGCSVIRGILLRSLLATGGAAVVGVIVWVCCSVIIGYILYLFSPWFGTLDVDLSLSWLGPSWWADQLRGGAKLGVVLSMAGALFGVIYGAIQAFRRTPKVLSWKPVQVVFTPLKMVATSASAVAHKFCPQITVTLPPAVQQLIDDHDKYIYRTWTGDYLVPFKSIGVEYTKNSVRINLEESSPNQMNRLRDYIYYDYGSGTWNETVERELIPS